MQLAGGVFSKLPEIALSIAIIVLSQKHEDSCKTPIVEWAIGLLVLHSIFLISEYAHLSLILFALRIVQSVFVASTEHTST